MLLPEYRLFVSHVKLLFLAMSVELREACWLLGAETTVRYSLELPPTAWVTALPHRDAHTHFEAPKSVSLVYH